MLLTTRQPHVVPREHHRAVLGLVADALRDPRLVGILADLIDDQLGWYAYKLRHSPSVFNLVNALAFGDWRAHKAGGACRATVSDRARYIHSARKMGFEKPHYVVKGAMGRQPSPLELLGWEPAMRVVVAMHGANRHDRHCYTYQHSLNLVCAGLQGHEVPPDVQALLPNLCGDLREIVTYRSTADA